MKKNIHVETLIKNLSISQEKFDLWVKSNLLPQTEEQDQRGSDFQFHEVHTPSPQLFQRENGTLSGFRTAKQIGPGFM